jgi:hypothetical protein
MTDNTAGWQSGWNTAGVPQPGGIPLRPLGVGDILNGRTTAQWPARSWPWPGSAAW